MLKTIKQYGLMYIAFLIYSISTICAKYAALQDAAFRILFFMILEVSFLAVYALLWQQVLRRLPLVTAMSSKGVVVIFNLIWSVLLFGEIVTWRNALGAIIIILGIRMVSKSD